MVETEQLEKNISEGEKTAKPTAEESMAVEPLPDMGDQTDNKLMGIKGSLKTRNLCFLRKSQTTNEHSNVVSAKQ